MNNVVFRSRIFFSVRGFGVVGGCRQEGEGGGAAPVVLERFGTLPTFSKNVSPVLSERFGCDGQPLLNHDKKNASACSDTHHSHVPGYFTKVVLVLASFIMHTGS